MRQEDGARLEARALTKELSRGSRRGPWRGSRRGRVFTAVQPLDLRLEPGSLTVIAGRSGSGKSTLLSMLAGVLTPTFGAVLVGGTDLYSLAEGERSRLRNREIGLVPQGHAALRSLTVLENVLLPSVLYSTDPPPQERAEELLERVGMAELVDSRPDELSGGELRRTAVARALLLRPQVVLADEPTAGLDAESTARVVGLLRQAADGGAAVLVVTHEGEVDQLVDRSLTMEAGELTGS